MARYRKKRQATQRKNLIGIVGIVAVLAVMISVAFFYFDIQKKQHTYNAETLCPIGVYSPKYIALVFDKSDEYNKVQQQFLRRFFTEFKAQILPGTQVSIYVVDANNDKQISPDFVVCAPRTGDDANAFYENPKLIRKRWHEKFEQPLDQAIDGFMKSAEADYSPIMEIFQTIALSAFPVGADKAQKQIILISDMLQHTPEWSHYRGQLDFTAVQRSHYYQRIRTDLKNAEVKILYVRREGKEKLQNKRHAYFWSDFIQSIGGRVTLIEKIDG